ncbi:hypothetical protein BJX61DRAFT_405235 [Aspergillus egyptiacus]|nr:hypothetical protein BJX61DRAFT_405235 [Aspergillus egyptiacus]
MRTNQPSPLPLLHTSFQPRPLSTSTTTTTTNTAVTPNHYSDYPSYSAAPTSPLSSTSTSTILSLSSTQTPTLSLPSSPTSPTTSPSLFSFQPVRPVPPIDTHPNHNQCQTQHHKSQRVLSLLHNHNPSKIDTILRQERTRYDEDAVERQGLDLLEPRPVDLDPIGIDARLRIQSDSRHFQRRSPLTVTQARMPGHGHGHGLVDERGRVVPPASVSSLAPVSQPRFVMGGIFEVMEGRE